jgi:hypothetical protein
MIGLATRGYLRRLYPPEIVLCGSPPSIVNSRVLAPQISGGGTGPQLGSPVIEGANALVPQIHGGPPGSIPVSSEGPTIIGGNLLVPIIRSGEED